LEQIWRGIVTIGVDMGRNKRGEEKEENERKK